MTIPNTTDAEPLADATPAVSVEVSAPSLPRWVHAGRYAKYQRATTGEIDPLTGVVDPDSHSASAALLYDWNIDMAAALFRDIGRLEIPLRNVLDMRLIQIAKRQGLAPWTKSESAEELAQAWGVPCIRTIRDSFETLETARKRVRSELKKRNNKHPALANADLLHDHIVPGLTFGFWRFLLVRLLHDTLWKGGLEHAFKPTLTQKPNRNSLYDCIVRIHVLRNRIAHHESVFDQKPEGRFQDILTVAGHIDWDLREDIKAKSQVPTLIAERKAKGF